LWIVEDLFWTHWIIDYDHMVFHHLSKTKNVKMIKHHMIYNGFPVALLIKIFHQEKPKQDMSVF